MNPQLLVEQVAARLKGVLQGMFCSECCAGWKAGATSAFTVDPPKGIATIVAAPETIQNSDGSLSHDPISLDLAASLAVLPPGSVGKLHYSQPEDRLDLEWVESFQGHTFRCQVILLFHPVDAEKLRKLAGHTREVAVGAGSVLGSNEAIANILALAGKKVSTSVVDRWDAREQATAYQWAIDTTIAYHGCGDYPAKTPDHVKPLRDLF